MAHVCGYCSACLDKRTQAVSVEGRARLGRGQCCSCQQDRDLYATQASDVGLPTDRKLVVGPGRSTRS